MDHHAEYMQVHCLMRPTVETAQMSHISLNTLGVVRTKSTCAATLGGSTEQKNTGCGTVMPFNLNGLFSRPLINVSPISYCYHLLVR
jgi:hypothetical protein